MIKGIPRAGSGCLCQDQQPVRRYPVGVIAAELYNRFSSVELHKALAFFSGRRLVPIVTSVVMIVVLHPDGRLAGHLRWSGELW